MILPLIALITLGYLFAARPNQHLVIGLVAAIVVFMALARGFYWHPFARGLGLAQGMSYNRLSAATVFTAAFYVGLWWQRHNARG